MRCCFPPHVIAVCEISTEIMDFLAREAEFVQSLAVRA